MLNAINTWSDYRSRLREFDAVLEYAKAVSAALRGLTADSPQLSYGEQIFVKLLAHAVTLRRLAPASSPQDAMQEPWDLASMCAVARCLVDAHDAFEYIAGHAMSASERGFRIRLWELHDATRRLKILRLIGANDPDVDSLRADAARLQLALESHEHLATLPELTQAELRLRLRRSDPPEYHLSRQERCALSGVDAGWHKSITLQLAQHAHTLPFSVQGHLAAPGGNADAPRLMALPLVFSLPFLVRVIQALDTLRPGRLPRPPSRTARTMQAWRELAGRGGAALD